ncbi:hypothetical protein [Enterococcus sp. MSG2901]|uniref:Uncharacterized protein n=1 Tax=Candidatus Enterococcus courvalinii TaxID=2815329 RepID=A0ABS3HX18_9ENTE|nr:hypothetical protein [Enterococcus sp. MSG2901]
MQVLDSVQVNEIDQGGTFVDTHFDELNEVDCVVFWDGEIERVKSFRDKAKADAVALLVDGAVVEG